MSDSISTSPRWLVQGRDGNFYGTTLNGGAAGVGTAFKMDASGTLTTLHAFNRSDGANPYGGLIQAADANFYGTTLFGGAYDKGTVFKMDASGTLTTLHSFGNGSDGALPYAGLIQAADGNFYGTAQGGGAYDKGTVFKMDASGTVTVLHDFVYSSEGAYPTAGLIQAADGNFYGTTPVGGAYGAGTVFRMDASGTLTTLHAFGNGSDGAKPYGGLIQAADGNFYGTTQVGGAYGAGTVFRMDASGTVTVLHAFNYGDGAFLFAAVIQAADGNFYGTAAQVGAYGYGTAFKMDASGTVTVLHAFNFSDGSLPVTGVIQAADGNFYGTAAEGGPNGGGVVFRLLTDTQPPALTLPANITQEATGPSGALVTYTATAVDAVDGPRPVTCSPASGSTFHLGTTTVGCSASDTHGNTATGSFTVTVQDTTPPKLTLPADITVSPPSNSVAVVTYTATAADLVDGARPVTCVPASGSTFAAGTTTVTCSSNDTRGNTAKGSFKVNVVYNFTGFFQPVANPPALNGLNAGSSVPVKFSLSGYQGMAIFAGGSPQSLEINCNTDAPIDTILDTLTTESSGLSYDAKADQYIYVWKTSSAWAGTCRQLMVRLIDGTAHVAYFQFTK